MKIARESLRHLEAAAEVAEIAGAAEGGRGRHHDRRRSDHHHYRTEHRVRLFVVQPSRGDALVNHVRLLEEELPRRDCGADDGEDHQRPRRGDPSVDSWHEEASEHGARRGTAERGQRQHDQPRADDRRQREQPLPPGPARRYIAEADGPERAMDVAGLIQNALSGNRSRVVLRRLALGHQTQTPVEASSRARQSSGTTASITSSTDTAPTRLWAASVTARAISL